MGSSAKVDADFNIFGYDPHGRIAHLASLFYGPDWKPTTYGHIRRLPGSAQAPRYGYPAPHQAYSLPTTFQPTPAPRYYGSPYPPYLLPPNKFDPAVFAALLVPTLEHRHRRRSSRVKQFAKSQLIFILSLVTRRLIGSLL